jgi:3-oxoadipate enol-lactonase
LPTLDAGINSENGPQNQLRRRGWDADRRAALRCARIVATLAVRPCPEPAPMPNAATLQASAVTLHHAGHGPPLVLLHCLGVDRHFWNFCADLTRDFTLLRYDLPGHGETAVPAAPYGIAELSAQLADVLAAHDIARAHVAGISLGGLIAQHFAATRPELVDRLILIDTTPRYSDELRRMWDERATTARAAGVAPMVAALLAIWFSADALGRPHAGVRYVRETLAQCPGEGYALACEALRDADLRALAPSIAARTLVVCGDDDIPSFLEAARWLAATIPQAGLAWIKGAKHASVLERPQEAVRLMRAFLQT